MTLLALLVLAAPARADDALSFGWTPGWRGTTEIVLTRTVDGEPAGPPLHAEARVKVKRDRATGDLLVTDALSFDAGLGLPPEGALAPPASVRQVVVHRIGPDGTHRGFEPHDAIARLSLEAVDAISTAYHELGPPDRRYLAPMFAAAREALSPEILAADQIRAWEDVVGLAGTPRAAGVPVPCHDGPRAPTCLELVHEGDRASLGDGVTAQRSLKARVEPGTLRPWALHRAIERTATIPGPDGAPREVTWVDTRTQVWRWRR